MGASMRCFVCAGPVEGSTVLLNSIERRASGELVWGPVPVHQACEDYLRTDFDAQLGDEMMLTWRLVEVTEAQEIDRRRRGVTDDAAW